MSARHLLSLIPFTAAVLSLGGCGLPNSGPRGEQIERAAAVTAELNEPQNVPYCLVPVSKSVVSVAIENRYRFSGTLLGPRKPTTANIGVGDVISVTLFESTAGGLFFPLEGGMRQGNFITLPNQTVDDQGNISVPYAGPIRASGRKVTEIQNAIVDALKNRALEPQAVVTLVERHADQISVLGEVNAPVRFPASASGERIIDAIARAGGVKGPPGDSWVLVERDGNIQTVPFEALMHTPDNNISIRAQDVVYVYKDPLVFLAFGATGLKGMVPFETYGLSVAEGLGKAGGLIDTQAEPGWVFLYRYERPAVVEQIDPACSLKGERMVPVIYQFDLRDPSGMFLANRFPMRNKDVIFAANSRTVEQTKFMNYIQDINRTVRDPIDTAVSAYTLKGLINGTGNTAVVVGSGGSGGN